MRKIICQIIINIIPFTRFFKVKALLLKIMGVKIGYNVRVAGKVQISNPCNLVLGNDVWIGNGIKIYNSGKDEIIIGDNVDIAPNCTLITGSHEIGTEDRRAGKGYNRPIKIGSGVWIGVNSTILPGVSIGASSIIAAGSTVTKDVLSNSLYGGVPAKLIKELLNE